MLINNEYAEKLSKQIRSVFNKHVLTTQCAECNEPIDNKDYSILMIGDKFYALCSDCAELYVEEHTLAPNLNESN